MIQNALVRTTKQHYRRFHTRSCTRIKKASTTSMPRKLSAILLMTLFVAIWLGLFKRAPQIAILLGCLFPMAVTVLSYKRSSGPLRKCVYCLMFSLSLVPFGIVAHASCYFFLGIEFEPGLRNYYCLSLCRVLDEWYLGFLDSICGESVSSSYLLFLSWWFDRGMDLRKLL